MTVIILMDVTVPQSPVAAYKQIGKLWRPPASNSSTKTGVGQASGFASVSGRKRPNSSAHFKISLTPYFAWGCFSIFLFRAANEALIELAPLMSHFGKTNPIVPRNWYENWTLPFWQNEPKLFQQAAVPLSPTYQLL